MSGFRFFARWLGLGAGIFFSGGATWVLFRDLRMSPPSDIGTAVIGFAFASLLGGVTVALLALAIRNVIRR